MHHRISIRGPFFAARGHHQSEVPAGTRTGDPQRLGCNAIIGGMLPDVAHALSYILNDFWNGGLGLG